MELREQCDDESIAARRLGPVAAEALKNRLADIRAADSIDELPSGLAQKTIYLDSDCVKFELAGGYSLILVPNHTSPRNDGEGKTAWNRVKRVRVVALESP